MSRRRSERIRSTLLSTNSSGIQWPRRHLFGLDFPTGSSPLAYVEYLLDKAGFRSPEQAAKSRRNLPGGRHFCHTRTVDAELRAEISPRLDQDFLRTALVLGLCSRHFYAPDNTLIWTESRLTRVVGLYQPAGFYEH